MTLGPALRASREILESDEAGLVNLYIDEHGGADAPPLVLLHGINPAASAIEMQPLFEAYRGRRRIFAPDLPGFGLSERSNRRYLPDLYVVAIADLLERIGEPADVVALALTAEIAAMTAMAFPERVRSLAFISPTGLNAHPNAVQRFNRDGRSPSIHHAVSNPIWAEPLFNLLTSRLALRYFIGQQTVGRPPSELLNYAARTARAPGARYAPLYFMSGALCTPDILRQFYVRLTQPVLTLYDRSSDVTFDALPELERRRPNWRGVRLAPSRGLVHWEHPDRTVAALDAFWMEPVEAPVPR